MTPSLSTPTRRTGFQKLQMAPTLLAVLLLVIGIRLGLTFSSYKKLRIWLSRLVAAKHRPADSDAEKAVENLVWAVQRTSRIVPGATCLTQAMAAQFLLARRGERAQIHIGVAKPTTGDFAAHAWLVWHGETILGGETSQYTPLTVFDLLPVEGDS